MSYRCAEGAARAPRQRGVALITVMLVFVLATLMATQMLRTGYLALRRTGNLIDSTQARYYALGAEELGRQLLAEDAKSAPVGQNTDNLKERWASPKLQFEFEDGQLELHIEDLAGRFNVNGLVDRSGKAIPREVARFARLLRELDIDPAFAEAAADWVDADGSTSRGGGETSAYGQMVFPNAPMVDPSEMRSLPGLDAAGWRRLGPFLAAIPTGTRLNVNTAAPEVLLVYAETVVRPADMERFVLSRDQQPIRDAADPRLGTVFGGAASVLDVRSDFFMLQVHAQYRGRNSRFETRVRRDPRKGNTTILGRSDASRI